MAKSATAAPKKPCPISREDFLEHAPKALPVKVGESFLGANVKEFSSGSIGWYAGDKVTIMVNGVPVPCQVGLNITVIGSKNGEE